jgi:hypothetical protein
MTTPNYGDLTRCPACDDDLGVPLSTEPDGRIRRPSLRLELCGEQRGAMDWRLSLWDGSKSWKPSPRFHPARVRLVYRVCGDGHVFLANVVSGGTNPLAAWRAEQFDVIAAVGGVAAGKSYLMLRALSQHLTVSGLTYVDTPVRPAQVHVYNADWLEAAPLELLKRDYHGTEVQGLPIAPTTYRYMLPFEFLADQVSPGLVQQILEIHEELLGADNVDKISWGQRIRQPIVRRYNLGGRRVLAAVADLPGEVFTPDSVQYHHHRYLLRNYGTLAWVIDTVICEPFVRFLPPEVAATSLAASMRPDAVVNDKTDEIRKERNHIQHSLADTLTELGGLSEDVGPVQYLLVCVTKADLIRLALHERSLRELGARDEVVTGVAAYLVEIARRAGGTYPTVAVDEGVHRSITGWINRFDHEPTLVRKAAEQLADRIVDYYSAPSAFWELVHGGAGADIDVPEREPTQILHSVRIRVPSLDEHVAYSLIPGEGGILRARDVIMSALGCGIAYGLGFGQSIDALLQQRWRELRFYLCSPLVEVPVSIESTDELIAPRERLASFPGVGARSAALSQLLLSMLRRLRP